MRNIQCSTPPLPQVENRSAHVRELLEQALASGAVLRPLPAQLHRFTVSMPPSLAAQIQEIAVAQGLAPGAIVGMLLAGLAGNPAGATRPKNADSDSYGFRPEQAKLFSALMPLLKSGRIVLGEAGTGTGKSRVLAAIARALLARRPEPVIVAAPTVNDVIHLLREWARLHAVAPSAVAPAVVLGRPQFVDQTALTLYLDGEDPSAYPELRRWLADGCPAGVIEDTRFLASKVPQIRGLIADMRALAPGLPLDRFRLSSEPRDIDDPSSAAYDGLRQHAKTAPLIFCTHAMVALDAMMRRRIARRSDIPFNEVEGILPRRQALLIDEAHQFEANAAGAASRGLSFAALRTVLQALGRADPALKTFADRAAKGVQERMQALSNLPDDLDLARADHLLLWTRRMDELVGLHDELSSGLALISKLQAKRPGRIDPYLEDQLKRARSILDDGTRNLKGHNSCHISFSPILRWPSMEVGPRSVHGLLTSMWENVDCAVLTSGTLYLPTDTGLSAKYSAMKLAIPRDRLAQIKPVHAPWSSAPTVLLPSRRLITSLTPPPGRSATAGDMRAWLTQVGAVVELAARTAAGGTLVLMSGYERARILGEVLDGFPDLIVQSTSQPLDQCRGRFIELARAGHKPVWIATGAAWVGNDIRDQEIPDERAEEDRLLTDLIIPNLPFGTIQTSTHRSRKEAFGATSEFMEAAITFRQGLGRLMRRANLKHRRIWALDGRLLADPPRFEARLCQKILLNYPDRQTFKMP